MRTAVEITFDVCTAVALFVVEPQTAAALFRDRTRTSLPKTCLPR